MHGEEEEDDDEIEDEDEEDEELLRDPHRHISNYATGWYMHVCLTGFPPSTNTCKK